MAILLMTFFWFPCTLLLMITAVIFVSLYSYKVKQQPLLDIIVHGFCFLIFFFFPALLLGLEQDLLIVGSLMVLSVSNIAESQNHLEDYESDKRVKINTTGGRFGKKMSKYICYFSAAVFIISLLFIAVFFNNSLMLVFLPLPILKIYSMRDLFNS